jgi:hypothetical protein
LILKLSQTET